MNKLKPLYRPGREVTVHTDKTVSYWQKAGSWNRCNLTDLPESELAAMRDDQRARVTKARDKGIDPRAERPINQALSLNPISLRLVERDLERLEELCHDTGIGKADAVRLVVSVGLSVMDMFLQDKSVQAEYVKDLVYKCGVKP
jgi:hypothetical protein